MRLSLTYSLWFVYILDLENELLQCEFTNELRNHREEIKNICNHIAVEIRPYYPIFRHGNVLLALFPAADFCRC